MKLKKTTMSLILAGSFASPWGWQCLAAETKINLCNTNTEKIFAAVAYDAETGEKIVSRGWWAIEANACIDLSLPVVDDRLYLFAQSSSQLLNWNGSTSLCLDTTHVFDYQSAADMPCNEPDQAIRAFREVSIAALSAPTGIPKYEFKPTDAVRVGGAIKFCNDTAEKAYLSLSQKKSSNPKFSVDGWFVIEAAKCFEARRDLEAEEVYFYAQGGTGNLRWRGDTPLCTDDLSGYAFDDAGSMDCKGNNQIMQLFHKERLTEREFEYHLLAADAHEVRSMVDLCNSRTEKSLITIAWERPDFAGDWVSRGWYVLDAGACVKDLAVDSAQLYIHVEDAARATIMEGAMEACIDQNLAFMFSHANNMTCDASNQVKARFAPKPVAPGKVRIDVP